MRLIKSLQNRRTLLKGTTAKITNQEIDFFWFFLGH